MKATIGFGAGLVFSVGLTISGMINPQKVIGFLDIFGDWDYSLAFVMGGAVLINLTLFPFILKRKSPIKNEEFDLPGNNKIDIKLLAGSAMFGIGWGLVGICPGPGIVNLVTFSASAIVFVAAMLFGILLYKNVR